ncbi:hypothetical protein EVG20_g3640 [Dentipellis fragilis]|uniref:SEC7 domain-containing protein n=1 Tax=Dentipellis fragilis TaxID=205917 RepID=A0A4Y9Z4I7_9AGAM|nr:hypothetical protein EVG20_g3640 [Dentipellis fragilis]
MPTTPYDEANGTVSPKHVLYSEILAVTSVMRKNSRWATSNQTFNTRDSALASNLGLRRTGPVRGNSVRQGSSEDDLMSGFEELKREVRNTTDIKKVPITALLAPFFAIIRSPLSTGPITSAALSALHSFFVCGLISVDSPSIDAALAELSSAVSHCKFEASDSSGDEVVLLRILTVIEDCMCGDLGDQLGDIEVCEMLETVLTTCAQMRLSEALRRSAELTMHALVRVVFSRLHRLDPEKEENRVLRAEDQPPGESELSMAPSQHTLESPSAEKAAELPETTDAGALSSPQNFVRVEYGLPSILELLRVIINILDPNERIHTDTTRLLALGILNVAFEVSGPRIGDFPSLRTMILDHGCKYLFQLARSENPAITHMALRTISTMLNTMRKHLKLQQELFLSFTIDRLAPPITGKPPRHGTPSLKNTSVSPRPGTPATASPSLEPSPDSNDLEKGVSSPHRPQVMPARGETRDLLLETLSQISRHPSFMVDLFTNYDCDINSENLFERIIELLTKSVYSSYYNDSLQQNSITSQYLCLDLLLTFVNDMTSRAEGASAPWPATYISSEGLMQSKSTKNLVLTGAARFNTKPKTGLAFLEENKLIFHDLSPEVSRAKSLATFLKSCTRLDKKLLGDFISRPENLDVLKCFMELFDFKGKPIAEAMRELLETFRLPGESQQIARITETFAEVYFASGPEEIKSQDAVYVLAYSVIMLNTDQHNPQIRKRMSIEDYARNLRGVNDGADFSPEYLQTLYDSIRKREIVMPEEHTGQLGFEFAWKELLARSRVSGELMICNSSHFDKEMFKAVWKSVISAVTHAFMTFDDDYIIERSIAGFRQCATLAGHFGMPDVFDYVVVSLSQATSLLSDSLPIEVPVYPVVEVERQSITISTLSVHFGANLKGQLAAVVLFNIVNRNGNAIREGWTQIFEMFENLFIHSLLPTRMLQMEDFLGGVSMIPLRGSSNQPSRPAPRSDGLLSALSSYLMTPYSSSQETQVPSATEADIENTLCAIDCITTCRLDELYAQIIKLELDPLVAAVRALEALAYERTVARLQRESDDVASTFDTALTPPEGSAHSLPYDPASVFLLEMMVSIVCQTSDHIDELWPIVFEHLRLVLSAAPRYSILLIERAVVSLLRICQILTTKPSLRDQIYISFDLLGGLPPIVANSVAEQIISGLALILQNHREVVRSQTEWNLVLALVRSTISHLEAARTSFDLIQQFVAEGKDQSVTVDNIPGLIAVLDDFSTAAGIIIEVEQQTSRRRPTSDSASSPVVDRGRKAIDLLYEILKLLPSLTEKTDDHWRLLLPALTSLSRQSTNASREIRTAAFSQLSRAVLGPLVMPNEDEVNELFNRVFFPLLDEMLKAPPHSETTEMRVRAAVLLFKAFMRFEIRETEASENWDVHVLWTQILELAEQLVTVDKSDQMYETVPESVKNVVLVMNAAGMLVPPQAPEDQRDERQRLLWDSTQERMERFLPDFLAEIIPTPPPPPEPPVTVTSDAEPGPEQEVPGATV